MVADGFTEANQRMRRESLLMQATQARKGLERWRGVGHVLRELVAMGVTFTEIREATGISRGTAHQRIARARVTGSTRTET